MSEFKVLMAAAYFLQAVIAHLIYSTFLNMNKSKRIYYAFFAVVYAMLWIMYRPGEVACNTAAMIIGNYIIAHFFFDGAIKHKVALTVLYTGCIIIGETIVLNVLEFIYTDYSITDVQILLIALISKVFLIIAAIIIKHKVRHELDVMSNKQFAIYFICMIFIIMILCQYVSIVLRYGNDVQSSFVMIFLSLGLMVYILLIFEEFCEHARDQKKIREDALVLQKMENDYKYYEQLKYNYEQTMLIKHDLFKHLDIISSYAHNNDKNSIINYISGLNVNVDEIVSTADTGNKTLDIILNGKLSLAEKNKVIFKCKIYCDMSFMDDIDATVIFRNILDNAFESCQRCAKRYINLEVYIINGCCINIYLENSVDMKFNTEMLQTTKIDKINHGYGMKSVKNVAEKYDGSVDCFIDEEKSLFITDITLYINENAIN